MSTLFPDSGSVTNTDAALLEVQSFFLSRPNISSIFGGIIRRAFDEVIDGARTGRYCIEELEKTEKTYIGTKVEILLRNELSLNRGTLLDNLISGKEVDTKFTVGDNWMIPTEAQNQICLLISGDDNLGTFFVGLLRATPDVLTAGGNRDAKKTVSAIGKTRILKIASGHLPKNFMLGLPPATRKLIMSQPNGRQAIKTLFENVCNVCIPRSVVEQLAQQRDYMRRAREMKDILEPAGYRVLCTTYQDQRAEIVARGIREFEDGDFVSFKVR